MGNSNKPIDPAVIIRKCDEALNAGAILGISYQAIVHCLGDRDKRTNGNEKAIEWAGGKLRKIRAAKDMIKRHGYG